MTTKKSKAQVEAAQPKTNINTVPVQEDTSATKNPMLEYLNDSVLSVINQGNQVDVEIAYRLLNYVDKMKGKRQSDDTITDQQIYLYNALRTVLESDREDYARRQQLVLKVIAEDLVATESAFKGIKPYRIDKVMNMVNTKHFTIWLTFFRQAAPAKNRASVLATTNLKEVAATISKPASRNAFLAFYGALTQY